MSKKFYVLIPMLVLALGLAAGAIMNVSAGGMSPTQRVSLLEGGCIKAARTLGSGHAVAKDLVNTLAAAGVPCEWTGKNSLTCRR